MVIERRLNRQWKLTELSLKCACHSAKTEMWVFFPVDEEFWNYFSWKLKKNYWMVTEICLPFSSVQWDWMLTKTSLNNVWNPDFSEHSVSNQWTFGIFSVDRKENFHPFTHVCLTNEKFTRFTFLTRMCWTDVKTSVYPFKLSTSKRWQAIIIKVRLFFTFDLGNIT